MLKKIALIFMLLFVMQTSVMAAVLEVDSASPEFKSDTWQNNVTSGEICPFINVFETTPTSGSANGGTDVADIKRYSGYVIANTENVEGAPSIKDGIMLNSLLFPFKETVNIEQITLQWNNGLRQYFLNAYTSIDGQNWDAVEFTANATKTTLPATYGETAALDGPSVDCWATTPSGIADNQDISPITFTVKTENAKYLKFDFYGNDGASGLSEIQNAWVSFNHLVIDGSVVLPEVIVEETDNTPAISTPAPQAPSTGTDAPQTVTAPQTGDMSLFILAAVCLSAAAAIVLLKKKRTEN
jgi:LPXTG-motif cell wall-anchored protein